MDFLRRIFCISVSRDGYYIEIRGFVLLGLTHLCFPLAVLATFSAGPHNVYILGPWTNEVV